MRTSEYFQNSFLPCVIREWNKLDPDKRSCLSYDTFHKARLNFIRPSENKIFNIDDQVGIELLAKLRLGFSHLCEHKFRHNFEGTLNPLCSYSTDAETTVHFFPLCLFFNDIRYQFFNDIREILMNDLNGSDAFDNKKNRKILICTVKLIKGSCRIDDFLF